MFIALGILAVLATPQEGVVESSPERSLPHLSPDLRYELGLRVRAMEEVFEHADADKRAAALGKIQACVTLFFSLNLPEAARALDQAKGLLGGYEPNWYRGAHAKSDLEWAASLCVTPNVWALEPGEPVRITVSQLYPVELPETIILKFRADGTRREVKQLPFSYSFGNLPKHPGPGSHGSDFSFNGEVNVGNGLREFGPNIEIIPDARKRARIAQAIRSKRKDELPGWVYATTRLHLEFLSALLRGDGIETRLPGRDLLDTTERFLAESSDVLSRPGALRDWISDLNTPVDEIPDRMHPQQEWIAVPREKGRDIARIFVPNELESERPPILLALHGAGGSENMFLDGYGNGKIRRLASDRGWILVCPRMQSGIQLGSFTKQMIELLGADPKRVFLLGHSMGAAAILSAATSLQAEIAPKGVLLLGGGRAVPRASALEALTKMNVFLAPGEHDFARSGAESLRDQLLREEHANLEYWLVPNTEHLTVVQASLERCFDWMQAQLDAES